MQKKILSHIIIGLTFKTIDNNDIEFIGGKIVSINGFDFEKGCYKIPNTLFDFETNITMQTTQKKKMSDIWEKYLVNFKKNRSFK